MHDDNQSDEDNAGRRRSEPLNTLFTHGEDADAGDDRRTPPHGGRKRARMACVQALYQWLVAGTETVELIRQFVDDGRLARADRAFFEAALRGVATERDVLQAAFDAHLSRPAAQLDPVEHAILLLATYELRQRPEIAYATVIDEACDMARIYGAEGGYRFINGVLDATARDVRPTETAGR